MDNSPTTPLQGAQLTGGPLLSLAAHHRRGSSCYLPDQRSQDPGAGSEAGSEDHPLLNAVGIRAKTIMTLESIRVTPSRSRRQFARTNCRCARRALFRDHEPARASLERARARRRLVSCGADTLQASADRRPTSNAGGSVATPPLRRAFVGYRLGTPAG